MKKYITIIFILILWCSPVGAATYYFRADGTASAGSPPTAPGPCGTAANCLPIANYNTSDFSAGDTLVFCDDGGVFRPTASIAVQQSGSDGSPITHTVESGDDVVIAGSALISTWASEGSNVWSAAVTTDPEDSIYFNGTRGTEQATSCPTNVNSTHEWCWDSNTLYVYSTTNPDSQIDGEALNPGIEAPRIDRIISLVTKDYITIQKGDGSSFTIRHSKQGTGDAAIRLSSNSDHNILDGLTLYQNDNTAGMRLQDSGTSNNTIQNCTISYTQEPNEDRGDGIQLNDGASSNTVTLCTIHHNSAKGIRTNLVGDSDNNTFSYNTIYQNGSEGIGTGSGSGGNTIEYNHVYENGQDYADAFNVDLFKPGNDNIVRWNICHDGNYISVSSGGIRFDGDPSTTASTGNEAYGNLIYNERFGMNVYNMTNGVKFYNNTVYNSTLYGLRFYTAANSVAKNNIIHTAGTYLVWNNNSNSLDIDNNIYYDSDFSNKFNWDGTEYSTLATFKAASQGDDCTGCDDNSLNSDPEMTTPGSQDFRIPSDSVAVDAGADVGTYSGLHPDTTSSDFGTANNVTTADWDTYGWNIGAYIENESVSTNTGIAINGVSF